MNATAFRVQLVKKLCYGFYLGMELIREKDGGNICRRYKLWVKSIIEYNAFNYLERNMWTSK